MTWREVTYRLSPKEVAAYDSSCKKLDAKELPGLLKQETLALYSHGAKLDPLSLRTVRPGTLIFVHPDPDNCGPDGGEKAAAEPEVRARGLGDFFSKQGYKAVPLQRLGAELVVQVRIGQNKLLLCLDTGASQTVLDRYRVRNLDLNWDKNDESDLDELQIGEIRKGPIRVAAYDMTANNRSLRYYNCPDIDGLLGADVIRSLGAVIDHPGGVLYMHKPEPRKAEDRR
jgi:hypothetical protein